MIYLNYADMDLQGDIPCYRIEDLLHLNGFLIAESKTEDCVFLVTLCDEIYITDHILFVISFIEMIYKRLELEKAKDINLFVQEYDSYEDAYNVALDLKENTPLRYSKDNKFGL